MSPSSKKAAKNDSSESSQETSKTDQEAKSKKPVRRGRTFGAAGVEKRG